MTMYLGGGIARNKLIQKYSKLTPEYSVTLDKDYIWVSNKPLPKEYIDIFDDVQISSSVEEYFNTRDISINQVLYSEESQDLLASELAIEDAKNHTIRQVEDGVRPALRSVRFAAILGWKLKLLRPLKGYHSGEYLEWEPLGNEQEYFEYQTTLQFLRAAQSGKGNEFKNLMKKQGIDVSEFQYHPSLLPRFAEEDPYDKIKKFDIDILKGIPKEYHHMIDAGKQLRKNLLFLASRLS